MDDIISVLLGLAGACVNGVKGPGTDALIVQAAALAAAKQDAPGTPDEETAAMVAALRAERDAVSPGCAFCTAPCGATSDYDMQRIYTAAPPMRAAKLAVLAALGRLAAGIQRHPDAAVLAAAHGDFFCRALGAVSYALSVEELTPLTVEADGLRKAL